MKLKIGSYISVPVGNKITMVKVFERKHLKEGYGYFLIYKNISCFFMTDKELEPYIDKGVQLSIYDYE